MNRGKCRCAVGRSNRGPEANPDPRSGQGPERGPERGSGRKPEQEPGRAARPEPPPPGTTPHAPPDPTPPPDPAPAPPGSASAPPPDPARPDPAPPDPTPLDPAPPGHAPALPDPAPPGPAPAPPPGADRTGADRTAGDPAANPADRPTHPHTRTRTRTWLRAAASAASLALAAYLVAALVPALGGVGWAALGQRLADVGPAPLLGLTALWLAGLWAYTHVLTGSLPGLRRTRAFSLNAAGSAVSNLLPFGGAAGVAVTAVMASSWGHTARAIATSAVVTGLWNAVFRVALPVVALAVQGAAVLGHGVLAATTATAGALALAVVALTRLRWLAGLLGGRARRWLLRLHRETGQVVRAGWVGMTLGMTAYLVLQALLLWCCLAATGARLPLAALVAAFAVSRLLTLAVITPGGFGVSENGTIALLLALGTPPEPAAAGVLLFAFFTYVLEIPLGGALWLSWSVRRARSA